MADHRASKRTRLEKATEEKKEQRTKSAQEMQSLSDWVQRTPQGSEWLREEIRKEKQRRDEWFDWLHDTSSGKRCKLANLIMRRQMNPRTLKEDALLRDVQQHDQAELALMNARLIEQGKLGEDNEAILNTLTRLNHHIHKEHRLLLCMVCDQE